MSLKVIPYSTGSDRLNRGCGDPIIVCGGDSAAWIGADSNHLDRGEFGWVSVSALFHHVSRIVGLCSEKKVRCVHACGVIATVQNAQSGVENTVCEHEGDAVSQFGFWADPDTTVTSMILHPGPQVAVAASINASTESGLNRLSISAYFGTESANSIPKRLEVLRTRLAVSSRIAISHVISLRSVVRNAWRVCSLPRFAILPCDL